MKKAPVRTLLLLVCIAFLMSACSGDGGAPTPAPQGNSDWGQMIWDQDNWA